MFVSFTLYRLNFGSRNLVTQKEQKYASNSEKNVKGGKITHNCLELSPSPCWSPSLSFIWSLLSLGFTLGSASLEEDDTTGEIELSFKEGLFTIWSILDGETG